MCSHSCQVQYVDVGGLENIRVDKLYKLPDHLRQVKFQVCVHSLTSPNRYMRVVKNAGLKL